MSNIVGVFLIYVWMKKCVEIYISVFKMLKMLLEISYQTGIIFSVFTIFLDKSCIKRFLKKIV